MDRKTVKSMQELIDLQDKAIQALQQANQALTIALDILWKSRQELGQPLQLFPQIPAADPVPWNGPYIVPNTTTPFTSPLPWTVTFPATAIDTNTQSWQSNASNSIDASQLKNLINEYEKNLQGMKLIQSKTKKV